MHRMAVVFLLLSAVCVTVVSAQEVTIPSENQTASSVPYNEIIDGFANGTEYRDSIDNIKYACSLTWEPYNETTGGEISKVSTKLRLATVCCPGYKRNHRGICQPHCSKGCGDGFCEFPEICTCFPNCAFNTVDRKCVCFEPVCPGGCPSNHTCVADNVCECSQGFIQSNNWTKQYTNSSMECVPYCFPFCTNKLFTTAETCVCNYTADGDNTTFGNESLEAGFYNNRKSYNYLGHLFQSHGHPSFTSGLVGFGLGALVGGMIGSHGKSKYKYGKGGKIYNTPGNFGMGGYGNLGHGYGAPGHAYNPGYGNAPHPGSNHGYPGSNVGYPGYNPAGQGRNYGGTYPGQGTNYGGTYPGQGTNVGGSYPGQASHVGGTYPGQASNVGGSYPVQGPPSNTNHGSSGSYGNVGQVPGYGVPPNTNQGAGTNYGAGGHNTGTHSGNAGQGTGTNYGWNTPGQGSQSATGNAGKPGQNSYGWSVPGQGSQGTNAGTGTNSGQRTGTNYGWSVPSNTNTGSNPGTNTGSAGKGSSSGTSWWPWSNSGKGNSGSGSGGKGSSNSGSGTRGRKRGKKH